MRLYCCSQLRVLESRFRFLATLIGMQVIAISGNFGYSQPLAFTRADYVVGTRPNSITVGDFNGDGKLDIAIPHDSSNEVSILLGDDIGNFRAGQSVVVGLDPRNGTVGDFNGDGHLDLAVANYTSQMVSVLLGNGDGTFQAALNIPVLYSPESVLAGDFNADGKLDLAVAIDLIRSDVAHPISVFLGKGDGTFQLAGNFPADIHPIMLGAGDFNGDGKVDLAAANATSNTVSILLGNGDGTFQRAVNLLVIGAAQSIQVGDFSGDGKLDLAVGGVGGLSLLFGNGDGTFEAPLNFPLLGNTVTAGDINRDGGLDLVVANYFSDISVLLGNGSGTFQSPVSISTGSGPLYPVLGDFNGDRTLDVIVANNLSDSISVLTNNTAVSDPIAPMTLVATLPDPNNNGWNDTNVTVALTATDNAGGSGVKEIQYSLSGAEGTSLQTVASNTASITISAEGITVLTYFATDKAGNEETAKRLTIKIDKTPPVISGMPAGGCLIWPPNQKLVQVATVAASDARSGLLPGSFTVIGTSNDPANGHIVITGGARGFNVQVGADKGEIYTLTATATDLAGNTAIKEVMCSVPHDQGN